MVPFNDAKQNSEYGGFVNDMDSFEPSRKAVLDKLYYLENWWIPKKIYLLILFNCQPASQPVTAASKALHKLEIIAYS